MITEPGKPPAPSDAELDRLGALGNLWALFSACEARLAEDPASEHARLYRGAALAGLGVGELAAESVEGMSGENAEAVRSSCNGTAPSAIEPERAIGVCRRNIEAAGNSFSGLLGAWEAWKDRVRAGERRLYQCADGNVLVVANDSIRSASDTLGTAQRTELDVERVGDPTSVNDLPGVLVVHLDRTPWLLVRVLERIARGSQGYTPRVLVGAPSGAEDLFDAISMTAMAVRLRGAPVRWFAGADAADEISEELRSLWRWALHARVLTASVNSGGAAALQAALDAALSEQTRRFESLTAETRRAGSGKGREFWRRRYKEALDGNSPLRVLIPCTRYTTYVRHAAEDLASAIRRAGDEAHVLLEPAPDLRPAATFELEAHAKFDPDLTIVSNWPRATRANAWPPTAPAVCWVQDMLGGLLDPRLGAAQGELDFTAGVLNGSLFRDFGYPLERAAFLITPACPKKFTNAPPAPDTAYVDVAYVSHQSETPEAMVERLIRSIATGRERDVIRELASALLTPSPHPPRTHQDIEEIVRGVLGQSATGDAVSRLMLMAALPIAERAHRHTMLAWAARICARHALTLALFGAGWERTPLAEHARGPLEHAETLRSSYASAGCHLHASLATNAHQRVFECALSGGLMLRRGPSPDTPAMAMGSQLMLWAETPAREENGFPVYHVHPGNQPLAPHAGRFDPIRYAAAMSEAPAPLSEVNGELVREQWLDPVRMADVSAWLPRLPLEQFPDWSYERASETLFESEEALEAAILRAVRDMDWRASTIENHRACALAHNTTDAFWSSLKHAISSGL